MTHMIRRQKAPKAKPRTSRQSKLSQKSSQHPRRNNNPSNSHTQQQQQHNIEGETSMKINPTLSKREACQRSTATSTKINPSLQPSFPLYSNNKNNRSITYNDQDMDLNPRCIDMSHDMLISDTDTLRQSMAPDLNNCADDIISLFGNIDGASLTKDDLHDLFGVMDSILDSDDYTIVSQSSSGGQCPTSYTQGSDNHSGDNYTFYSTCLFDLDMDLILNDDELTHDIISLFGT
jgi:hypothetical protein